jgi:hypothetical protein
MNHKLSQYSTVARRSEHRSVGVGKGSWLARIIALAALIVIVRPTDAWAYIDPSTGSYLLQMLLAGIVAAALAIRIFWTNLKLFFQRIFSGNKCDDTDKNEPTD